MDESTNQIERRILSDRDAQTLANVGGAVVKAGAAAVALVAVGPVAAVGVSLATELAGVVFDGQKERLANFASRFSHKTAQIPIEAQERIRAQLSTDAGSRIFEIAWHQAAREVDPEKLDYLASLLTNGLSAEQLREHQTRWLLKLLNELDAVQIVVLRFFLQKPEDQDSFLQRHSAVFENKDHPQAPQFIPSRQYSKFVGGWLPQNEEERAISDRDRADWKVEVDAFNAEYPHLAEQYELARERHALYRSRLHALVEMGLLGGIRTRGRFTNDVDIVSEALTPLGIALLKVIDVAPHGEWGTADQVSAVQAMQQTLIDIAQNSEAESKTMYDAALAL